MNSQSIFLTTAFLAVVLSAMVLAGCGASQAAPVDPGPGVTAPDPEDNSLRVNGVLEIEVFDVNWHGVWCTIAPLGKFRVYERSFSNPEYRWVESYDGTCYGYAWMP